MLLISGATQVHRRVRTRLDRAFFRSSYDAQQILENLAAKTLNVSSREGLAAAAAAEHLRCAASAFDVRIPAGQQRTVAGVCRQSAAGSDDSFQQRCRNCRTGGAQRAAGVDAGGHARNAIGAAQPECLVPIRGSSEGAVAGSDRARPRLSEEPYSASDKRLLASVASQAGIAMRSITLAEKMAERMEAERRTEQEMQIARQVQSRLLPQQAPSLKTLDCAGKCIQTRAVGGDYYDFLDLGSGRLGLVLADISGKGMSAALLMANLQANLRGQYALALEDIPRLLRSVNRLFYKNTETSHYATMFFAVYDDETRRLRYVNCGHNPPMLLRANGDVERLEATATVLGLFEEWDCTVAECELASGDVLVIYTDGISEAGAERRGRVRRRTSDRGDSQASAAIRRRNPGSILSEVQQFSQGEQADDMTLIVASCL